MKEETQKRLKPTFDKVIDLFVVTSGADSYEAAIAKLREQCRDKVTSPAPWLHKIARQIYRTDKPDSVKPDNFYEILGLIDTREKATAVFVKLPEEGVPEIEKFFSFLLKVFFPSLRLGSKIFKKLPQRRGGGRPPTMPSEDECRAIYGEVEVLDRKRVLRGIAQRRVADKYGLSLRMVQRICSAQEKKVRNSQFGEIEP